MRWLIVLAAVLVSCGPSATPAPCPVTPIVTRTVNGHALVGTEQGDVFVYPVTERGLRTQANGGPEKLLVFVTKLPTPLPASIAVSGKNLDTGSQRTFEAALHASEFGTEWGTNFSFPDAGCWRLSVDSAGNQGNVVVVAR